MAEEATKKSAEKIYNLEDIKFNEANKTMAIIACIPLIGLILLFTEKDDRFVRYMAAQFGILFVVGVVIGIIPALGWLIAPLFSLAVFIFMILAIVKISKGERYDVPVVSVFALKIMGKI